MALPYRITFKLHFHQLKTECSKTEIYFNKSSIPCPWGIDSRPKQPAKSTKQFDVTTEK